ncbi:argininosuccinate lyase [Limnochorda pilosa]|uniref:Argininosuccinate lyase n=1 Tax=Limnochorda pilosa TaxID=1555112 RepID=A0A0K2SJ40_LIMPI|nr:argininosuccinate lyase [Limnochorda pilosa]BAS27105.1 argininosuccinate lyase [Limnochorda pilosa]
MQARSGRFREPLDETVAAFQNSFPFDQRLFRQDVQGSRAHVRMLARQGILAQDEVEVLLEGLDRVEAEFAEGRFEARPDDEDVHMAVERRLVELVGDAGKRLHTARSRNDQVALDLRLWLREEMELLDEELLGLQAAFLDLAEAHPRAVMPGYTHLQRAQPVLLAHHLLAYVEMLERDRERFRDARRRMNLSPLGAGALAGVPYPVDPQGVATELGFAGVCANSLDAVSDRDHAVEFLAAASLLMVHVSRLAEELVLWSSQEFGFVELPDRFATGSSIMPQKKNPDVPELVRGKTGRVVGHLVGLLVTLKGLPLAYNKDLQEDKEPLFDTADTLHATLRVLAALVPALRVDEERMRRAAEDGYLTATELADALVRRGVPFREAHHAVGALVAYARERGCRLSDLTGEELVRFHPRLGVELLPLTEPQRAVDARKSWGGTGYAQVEEALARARRRLEQRG